MINNSLVSVVIINFNSDKFIWRSLEALDKQTYKNLEIFVVDNASTDGSSEKLQNINRKDFNYYKFETNVGSSVANNYGIKNSNGKFVLILNADVFLSEDYIEKSIIAFNKDTKIGTVTGKLLSESNHKIIDTTGIILFKEGVGHERGMDEEDNGQYDIEDYVVGACCAAAMYKREMLEDIRYEDEYYDEDYFAFVEDLDLSVCATLLGWKTLYTYKALAYHVRGGSTSSMSDFVKYLNIRNSEIFFDKFFKNNKKIYIYHFILKVLRYFTINQKIRNDVGISLKELKSKQLDKRLYFSKKIDYIYLEPFLKNSYVFKRLFR